MLLGVDRKNISLHTNHMFAIMMPDISEIQVLSLFLKLLKKKGDGIMRKKRKMFTSYYTPIIVSNIYIASYYYLKIIIK